MDKHVPSMPSVLFIVYTRSLLKGVRPECQNQGECAGLLCRPHGRCSVHLSPCGVRRKPLHRGGSPNGTVVGTRRGGHEGENVARSPVKCLRRKAQPTAPGYSGGWHRGTPHPANQEPAGQPEKGSIEAVGLETGL